MNLFSKFAGFLQVVVRQLIWLIFAVMLTVGGLQVVCRYGLRHSLSWSEELQKYAHIWIVFLAIPLAYRQGRHIGMNLLIAWLPKVVGQILFCLFDVGWLAMGLAMVIYTLPMMRRASFQISPALGVRMDYVYTVIAISGLLLALLALEKLLDKIAKKSHLDVGCVSE